MSSDIIYHAFVTRLPASANGNNEDLYFYLTQAGSSNCYEIDYRRPGGHGRRSRSWNLMSMGTRTQVLNTAINFAGSCEGGMLKLGNASTYSTPEQLIRKTRKLLQEADGLDIRQGVTYKGHSIQITLKATDNAPGSTARFFDYSEPNQVKDFLEAHAERLSGKVVIAWNMATVRGPEMR